MRYSISKAKAESAPAPAADTSPYPSTIRFGDVDFQLFDEAEPNEESAAAGRAAAGSTRTEVSPPLERLHMVVQKGRLFQREHPEIPVLLDKGRYLVVDLEPRRVAELARKHRPCFAIRPLPASSVAFEQRRAPAARAAGLPWVSSLVAALDRASYEADMGELVAFPTRISTSSHYLAAATLVRGRLAAMGFGTRLQTVSIQGVATVNVIADQPGRGPNPRQVVLVGAHLDSINLDDGAAAPAPGADDDASGCAGLLAIARVLAGVATFHDLRLVFFGGEEQGLLGSRRYVASLPQAQRRRIRAMVNMDMIATVNTAERAVLLEGASLSAAAIDGLAAAAETYTQLEVQTSLQAANSDHVSFLVAGIPAVLTIEGTDSTNHRIHTADDLLDHLDFDLALEILRMNLAFVAQELGQQAPDPG